MSWNADECTVKLDQANLKVRIAAAGQTFLESTTDDCGYILIPDEACHLEITILDDGK
jgi:hypothetical protein